MTKPLPPHGTYARSVGRPAANISGCHCQPCKTVRSAYNARRRLLAATGRALTVPPDRAATHIRYLLDGGASWPTLHTRGCDSGTISRLLTGTLRYIYRSTEQRILSIRLHDVIAPTASVPSTGSIRRIKALLAIGHQMRDIAAAAGYHRTALAGAMAHPERTVTAAFAQGIADAYARLCMTPGASARSILRARREGWAPPLAWDDDMDDPNATPVVLAEPVLNREEQAAIRAAEVVHLAAYGLSHEDIGARIGMTAKYVSEVLHKERRKLRVA